MDNKLYYVPCFLQKWSDLKGQFLYFESEISPNSGMGQYYLPVFENKEELIEEYPTAQIMIIGQSETPH